VFDQYNKTLNKLFDYCEPLGIVYDSSNRILAFNLLFSKALKTYFSIYTMCKEGYATEAFILFRSLIEIRINMKYLWNSDYQTGDRFIEYVDYIKYDYLMSVKKNPEDYDRFVSVIGNVEELKEKHDRFITKYQNIRKHYWSGLPTKQMIEKLPPESKKVEMEAYERIYRLCSFHVHTNVMALKTSISESGMFRISPNLDDIESIFPSVTTDIIELIGYWLACMEVPQNSDLLREFDILFKCLQDNYFGREERST